MALMYSHQCDTVYMDLCSIVSVPAGLILGFIIIYLCKLENVSVQIEKYRQTLTKIGEQWER